MEIVMIDFINGFEKRAASLTRSDAEKEFGYYIRPGKGGDAVDTVLAKGNKKMGIKHPILTGIPTLGMWPAASRSNTMEDVDHEYKRHNPKFTKAIRNHGQKERELSHRREVDLMPKTIDDRKRSSHEKMLGTGAAAALSGLNAYMGYKNQSED